MFDYALSKTANIKNVYKKGVNAKGKILWGVHYPIAQFRKSVITVFGAAGLSTSQIQTYTTHTSAAMVDHYVQQHQLEVQRRENDQRIRNFIAGGDQNGNHSDNQPQSSGVDFIDQLGLTANDPWPFDFDETQSLISCSPSLKSYARMLCVSICFASVTNHHKTNQNAHHPSFAII